jgi:hypothetical protein
LNQSTSAAGSSKQGHDISVVNIRYSQNKVSEFGATQYLGLVSSNIRHENWN